jgi:hypothetical protein
VQRRKNGLKTPSESILLFGLSTEEKGLIKGLISSFEIELVDLSIDTIENFIAEFPEKKICLIVYHVDENQKKDNYIIRAIRNIIGSQVPFLILVPQKKLSEISKYLKAGADDYIDTPLKTSRFSLGFLILLELGQTIARLPKTEHLQNEVETGDDRYYWNRIVNYFQAGLSYFTPKTLIPKARSDNIFDKWKKVKKLGKGGFGIVWLVKEIGTGRLAVAKTPHSSSMNVRVLRSAAIFKRLVHHPNIIQLIEMVREEGKFVLIQEYIEGPTLQRLLTFGLSPFKKEDYYLQLLSAVSYAHKHKILHRDIKPENIIINMKGQLKLLDFGIAQDLSWQTPRRSSEGTLNFMPPEQLEGNSCIASDVWALGVILYILAANAVPYIQQNEHSLTNVETSFEIKPPREINPNIDINLDRIIMRCLQKDLQRRYQDATELQDDLQTAFPRFGKGEIIPG